MEKRGLAAYDIDGTIMPKALFERAFWRMEEAGLITAPDGVLDECRLQREEKPLTEAYLWDMVEHYSQFTKGMDVKSLNSFAEELAEEEIANIYPQMLERLEQDREENELVFITGTPKQLVEPLARRLDAKFYFGTKYYEENGKISESGKNISRASEKHRILGKLAAITGLGAERAYGDSMSDYTMLKIANMACAVNPSDDLREAALERNWEIIDCEEREV